MNTTNQPSIELDLATLIFNLQKKNCMSWYRSEFHLIFHSSFEQILTFNGHNITTVNCAYAVSSLNFLILINFNSEKHQKYS